MFGNSESYRMAWGELEVSSGTREALKQQAMEDRGRGIADGIERACNSSSSWGFYQAWHGRVTSRVYVLNPGRERGRRLLSAAGRGGW